MRRQISIDELGDNIFHYKEQCEGKFNGIPFDYSDQFKLRWWEPERVLDLLGESGLTLKQDLTEDFTGSASHYFLVEKAN